MFLTWRFEKAYGACNRLGRAEYIQQPRQLLRRNCAPAFGDPFADMVPIGIAKVEPDAHPAIAEISGAVISCIIAIDQHCLFFDAADF